MVLCVHLRSLAVYWAEYEYMSRMYAQALLWRWMQMKMICFTVSQAGGLNPSLCESRMRSALYQLCLRMKWERLSPRAVLFDLWPCDYYQPGLIWMVDMAPPPGVAFVPSLWRWGGGGSQWKITAPSLLSVQIQRECLLRKVCLDMNKGHSKNSIWKRKSLNFRSFMKRLFFFFFFLALNLCLF